MKAMRQNGRENTGKTTPQNEKPEFDVNGIPRVLLERWRGQFGKDILNFIDGEAKDLNPNPGGLQRYVEVYVGKYMQSVESWDAGIEDIKFARKCRNYPMLHIYAASEVALSYFFKRDGMGNPVCFNPYFSKLIIKLSGESYIKEYKEELKKLQGQKDNPQSPYAKDKLWTIKTMEKNGSSLIDDELFRQANKHMEDRVGDYFTCTTYGRLYQKFEKKLSRGKAIYGQVPVGLGGTGWYLLNNFHEPKKCKEYNGSTTVLIDAAKRVDVKWPSDEQLAEEQEKRRQVRLVFNEKKGIYEKNPKTPGWRFRNGEEDLWLIKVLSAAGAALTTNKFCLCAVECQPNLVTQAEYAELWNEDKFFTSKMVHNVDTDTGLNSSTDFHDEIWIELVEKIIKSFNRGNGNSAAERREAIEEYLIKAHQNDEFSSMDLQGNPTNDQLSLDRIEAKFHEIDTMPEPQRAQTLDAMIARF